MTLGATLMPSPIVSSLLAIQESNTSGFFHLWNPHGPFQVKTDPPIGPELQILTSLFN